MTILNKEFLVKELQKNNDFIEMLSYYNNKIDCLHDCLLEVKINNITIEEYDALYYEMCSIINKEGNYIINQIEESQHYFGDPAFSSASDYWGYILGE